MDSFQFILLLVYLIHICIDFNPPIDVVVQCGVVPSFVNFLATASNVKEKIEVLCCLTNIACGSDTVIELLLECNIVSVLLNILQTDFTLTVRERCYWMASNLSHSLDRSRHLLISEGILDLILEELGLISSSRILPRPSLGLLRIIVWTLCNLSRYVMDFLFLKFSTYMYFYATQ